MCAIELHPDSNTRDSLTHTLFNLIKRPDEQQRRVIMDVRFWFDHHALPEISFSWKRDSPQLLAVSEFVRSILGLCYSCRECG